MQKYIRRIGSGQKTGAQIRAHLASQFRILQILKGAWYHPRRTKSFRISL